MDGNKSIINGNIHKNSGYKLKKGAFDISDIAKKIPSPDQVRQIFNDTYNVFYKKWKDISSPDDWVELTLDAGKLNKKYDCVLCHEILMELVKCIENEFLQREATQ